MILLHRLEKSLKNKLIFLLGSLMPKGSVSWLIAKELKYGGLINNVKRRKVSLLDPRTSEQIASGGMQGGDRMLHHGYAKKYSQYLAPFLKNDHQINIVEIGILKGTGLSIWCDLFPDASVYGFDIDLSHIEDNFSYLKSIGAFSKNKPILYEFDQFLNNKNYLKNIFGSKKINICIDDGFHSDEAVMSTLVSMEAYLADDFVYFIEDNSTVHKLIYQKWSNWKIESSGLLTVISPK